MAAIRAPYYANTCKDYAIIYMILASWGCDVGGRSVKHTQNYAVFSTILASWGLGVGVRLVKNTKNYIVIYMILAMLGSEHAKHIKESSCDLLNIGGHGVWRLQKQKKNGWRF